MSVTDLPTVLARARPALAMVDGRDWPERTGPDVTSNELAFARGWRDYRAGKACPPRPSDDDPASGAETSEWLGWMLGRADVINARAKARELLGIEDVEWHCTLVPPPTND